MAWTYSNYITQSTAALQLSVLRQFIQEIMDKIDADVSADSYSRANHPLNDLLDRMFSERDRLESDVGAAINGGMVLARPTRAT